MSKTKRLTLRLDNELHRDIESRCRSLGCCKSEFLEAVLRSAVEDEDYGAKPNAAESYKVVEGTIRPNEKQEPITPKTRRVWEVSDKDAASRNIQNFKLKEVWHDSGCIDRYDNQGRIFIHLRPDVKEEGRQYYRDILDRQYYKNGIGNWVLVIE